MPCNCNRPRPTGANGSRRTGTAAGQNKPTTVRPSARPIDRT